jgi:hypothetical protein
MVFNSMLLNASNLKASQFPKTLLIVHTVGILDIALLVILSIWSILQDMKHRDSFLRSQSHGPLALCEGGIIARLAREVLPNSKALFGPSLEALNGDHARFICNNSSEIYVADNFLDAELGLICGTYSLGMHGKGGNGYH